MLICLDFIVLSLIPFSILLPLLRRRLSSLLFAILVSVTINWFSSLSFSLSWKFLWISWQFVDLSCGGFSCEFVFPAVSSFLATLLSIWYSVKVSVLSLFFSIINPYFCSKQLLLLMLLIIGFIDVVNNRFYIWMFLMIAFANLFYPFKRQSRKMVKHTQTIRRQFSDELFNCVWPLCEIGA